jgi:hypothetical protein
MDLCSANSDSVSSHVDAIEPNIRRNNEFLNIQKVQNNIIKFIISFIFGSMIPT